MKTLKKWIGLTVIILFTSCQSLQTAVYDQYSYQKTTALKIEAESLMSKASSAYETHKKEVELFLMEVAKLKEYEKNKPKNEITYEMWNILTDEEKNLLTAYFKKWEKEQSLSPFFIKEASGQIIEAFDLLIEYEIKKDKISERNLLNVIAQN